MSRLKESEIFEGLLSDKNWAYKEIMLYHTSQLKSFVISNNGNEADAVEIEQRCIIILYENIVSGRFKYNPNVKFNTYLYSIAQHQWLNELKRRKSNLPSVGLEFVHFPEDINDSLAYSILEERLVEALSSLDSTCLELIKKKYYDKWSDQLIAETLQFSNVDNVRKRRYKCLGKLKSTLEKKYFLKLGDINLF